MIPSGRGMPAADLADSGASHSISLFEASSLLLSSSLFHSREQLFPFVLEQWLLE
jgi:hypothetical protein